MKKKGRKGEVIRSKLLQGGKGGKGQLGGKDRRGKSKILAKKERKSRP